MREIGQSRRRLAGRALCATAVAALFAAPPVNAAPPAVDEYTLRLPTVGGEERPTTAPQARPGELPAAVGRRLAGAADGPALTQIATATQLGAPESLPEPKAGAVPVPVERSVLFSAAGTLGQPAGLLIGASLAAIGLAAFLTRRARRADS